MNAINSIAIVVNPEKTGAYDLANKLTKETEKHGVNTHIFTNYPVEHGQLEDVDLCCVIGGDGTILGVVTEAVRAQTPVLGINLGKLGFLATYTPDEIKANMSSIIHGRYCMDSRSLLQCGNGDDQTKLALNDIAIKSTSINLIQLQVFQDKHRVAEYSCDGLIFASPTGSTAYNLSSGGPIIHPQNNSIAMTPICPHTLSNRSFIFPDTVNLKVECDCQQYSPSISVDGQPFMNSQCHFPFNISMAKERLTLIHDPQYSHYRMLRKKLNWV